MLKLKKLLVLGGCGLIGAEVVRDLAATSEFEKITVADGNIEKAEELVASLNDPRFDARAVQVKDKASVVALMKDGYDLVCNCLPFEFDTYITQCCVDAGVTGTDLGATKDQLAMNGLLEEKGLLFVVCDGISPGTSNMIASYANEKLDRLDEVHIAFASFRAIQTAPGLVRTTLWELDPNEGGRSYYEGGKQHYVGPFSGEKIVDFPEPFGPQPAYYVPHNEVYTISDDDAFCQGLHDQRRLDAASAQDAQIPQRLRLLYYQADQSRRYRDCADRIYREIHLCQR